MRGPLAKIPPKAALLGELHCLSTDGLVVMTVQHWRGVRVRTGEIVDYLRLVRNGRPYADIKFAGANRVDEVAAGWEDLATRYAPTALTESEMWEKLRELGGIEQDQCARGACGGASIPVGRTYCPACFCSIERVAAGSLSDVRRRGDILWDLRTPRSESRS